MASEMQGRPIGGARAPAPLRRAAVPPQCFRPATPDRCAAAELGPTAPGRRGAPALPHRAAALPPSSAPPCRATAVLPPRRCQARSRRRGGPILPRRAAGEVRRRRGALACEAWRRREAALAWKAWERGTVGPEWMASAARRAKMPSEGGRIQNENRRRCGYNICWMRVFGSPLLFLANPPNIEELLEMLLQCI